MNFAIPARRLRETETLLAFHHPKHSHSFHVLLVLKQAVLNLMELSPSSAFLADLVVTVQSLVAEFQLPAYRLIVNGGGVSGFPAVAFSLGFRFTEN